MLLCIILRYNRKVIFFVLRGGRGATPRDLGDSGIPRGTYAEKARFQTLLNVFQCMEENTLPIVPAMCALPINAGNIPVLKHFCACAAIAFYHASNAFYVITESLEKKQRAGTI